MPIINHARAALNMLNEIVFAFEADDWNRMAEMIHKYDSRFAEVDGAPEGTGQIPERSRSPYGIARRLRVLTKRRLRRLCRGLCPRFFLIRTERLRLVCTACFIQRDHAKLVSINRYKAKTWQVLFTQHTFTNTGLGGESLGISISFLKIKINNNIK